MAAHAESDIPYLLSEIARLDRNPRAKRRQRSLLDRAHEEAPDKLVLSVVQVLPLPLVRPPQAEGHGDKPRVGDPEALALCYHREEEPASA